MYVLTSNYSNWWSTCYRRNVSKDDTSRFGSNENIFPVCQSFETFHLVDSKCFQIKYITNKFFFTGRCHFQLSNIRITKWFWLCNIIPLYNSHDRRVYIPSLCIVYLQDGRVNRIPLCNSHNRRVYLYIPSSCVVYLQDGRVNRFFRNAHDGRIYIISRFNE
jgi:hypothetical protein